MEPQAAAVTPIERDGLDATAKAGPADEALVVEELLVEDVSIDGMCGVY
jgi:mycofactocin precursor